MERGYETGCLGTKQPGYSITCFLGVIYTNYPAPVHIFINKKTTQVLQVIIPHRCG